MNELIKIDSGTPEFDALVEKRYRDYPRVERELKEARSLLIRAADALESYQHGPFPKLIAELRKAAL